MHAGFCTRLDFENELDRAKEISGFLSLVPKEEYVEISTRDFFTRIFLLLLLFLMTGSML